MEPLFYLNKALGGVMGVNAISETMGILQFRIGHSDAGYLPTNFLHFFLFKNHGNKISLKLNKVI